MNTAVLIVGGGLVGLSAGLFLQHLGVPFVLVERSAQPSPLPRSRGIHVRTMELFRQVGLQADVEAAAKAAWVQGGFGGARRGRTLLEAEPLPIRQVGQVVQQDPSPCSFCACPQTTLEPVLRAPLEARGGDVRFGHELVSFRETAHAIEATVKDAAGAPSSITASYLIAADGGRSFVRKRLGIGTIDTPARQHLLNVFFRADLTEQVRGRTFSQCLVDNDRVRGLFSANDNATHWTFHLDHDPAVSAPEKLPEAELVALVQAAIGAEVPVEIVARAPWSTAVRVAKRYRAGRVFLGGDAAHVMPPWGGFNGNTGIADVHNLAAKLAVALRDPGAALELDSYETERRPVAVRNGDQALLRTDFDARFGLATPGNRDVIARMEDIGALLTRYRYGPAADTVPVLRAQTGTRFPHAWIVRDGERISTLDLFGRAPVRLTRRDLAFVDPETSWSALTGLPADGSVLVRPDGFVAERTSSGVHS